MGVFEIILIVCICLFLFCFCLLYHKKIKEFFVKIWDFFVRIFSKILPKKKQKVIKKDRAQKSLVQSRPILKLPEPQQKKEEKKEDNKDNKAQETLLKSGKFTSPNQKQLEKSELEKQKEKISQTIDEISKDYIDFNKIEESLDDDDDLEGIDDYDRNMYNKLKQNSTVQVDGEDIDLMRLPPKIRRLLLSGVLDRKDFDN